MSQNCLTGWISTLCLALMFALMWIGGASPIALIFVGLGAALTVLVCVLAELR